MICEVERGKSDLLWDGSGSSLYLHSSQKLSRQGDLTLQLLHSEIHDAVQLWEEAMSLSILSPVKPRTYIEGGMCS